MPTAKPDDILQMLQHLDRRLRLVEWCLSARQARLPAAVVAADAAGEKKGRGRPPGARSLPKIEVGLPLFDENNLDAGELVGLRVIEGWLRAGRSRRPKHPWSLVEDDTAWHPPPFRKKNDTSTRAWHHLTMLRAYMKARGALAAFAEGLKVADNMPADDPSLVRSGLAYVIEYIELGRIPRRLPGDRDAAAHHAAA
jgi:hypothetical protein